jgi:phospholipase C
MKDSVNPDSPSCRHLHHEKVSGWYNMVLSIDSDPDFKQQFAGHLETGHPSRTDPEIGAVGEQ